MKYLLAMAKSSANSAIVVRDSKTGRFVTVRGAGSMKDSGLPLKKGVDLTKPIAAQVLARADGKKG
jgi:hypothetical protein